LDNSAPEISVEYRSRGDEKMVFRDLLTDIPDPEVVPKAKRRKFSVEYKRRILEEADNCTESGQTGALLRREGLYSSHLTTWRRQREEGLLEGSSPKKRGRKRKDELEREVASLRRENERLQVSLEQAEMIIEVQKKLSRLLGLATEENETGRQA
jgi:transposase